VKRSILVIVLLMLGIFSMVVWAEVTPPAAEWSKHFGGTGYDSGFCVRQTPDHGYIVAGMTRSFSVRGSNAYLIKTDSAGNEVWSKTYGGWSSDYAYSVCPTTDGGYALAGGTWSFDVGGASDVYLVKTDAQGSELWRKAFGGGQIDYARSIRQTSDGGFIMAGYTRSFGAGASDIYLLKTDSRGNLLWSKTFGGKYSEWAYMVRQTVDGGYIAVGYTSTFDTNGGIYLVKTDGEGNLQWARTLGGPKHDDGHSVQQTPDGGYIVVGTTQSFNASVCDICLVKVDPQGIEEWSKTYGGRYGDDGWDVCCTPDGGYVFSSNLSSDDGGGIGLIKTDSAGNEIWRNIYKGGWSGRSLERSADGGYIVLGDIYPEGKSRDILLVKVESENAPPVAHAGQDQTCVVGETVELDGSGSSDPDGDPLTYRWQIMAIPAGSLALLSDPHDVKPSILADIVGSYTVNLVVNDGTVDSEPASVTITAISIEEAAANAVQTTSETIAQLPVEVFANKNMADTFIEKIEAVLLQIDQGDYKDAYNKLTKDLIKKTDGCAETGKADRNDWIEDCESQAQVYTLINTALDLLRNLI
jgi:hypothetical protein